jgi:antitoxin CptB
MMAEPGIGQLRWRCRRGMRELDVLMERYLERGWPQATTEERGIFLRLLDCEDDKLWAWCMQRQTPEDPELAHLVRRILDLPA